jgi:CheY-like chemotaxis protein/Tfp pilus assembly protein PilZ
MPCLLCGFIVIFPGTIAGISVNGVYDMNEPGTNAPPAATERHKRFLLIVDSDPHDLFYTAMLLQRFEYNIYTAKTVEEAVDMVSIAVPALIIINLHSAELHGTDLAMTFGKLRSTSPVPAIVTVSDLTPEKEAFCLRVGSAACIRKPIKAEELYRAVQNAIELNPRKNIRIPTCLPVAVDKVTLGYMDGECVSVISEQGVYIRTLKPYPVGATVSVQLMVKNQIIKVESEVRDSYSFAEGPFKQPGMGVQFTQINPNEQELIRQFIAEELGKGIKPM